MVTTIPMTLYGHTGDNCENPRCAQDVARYVHADATDQAGEPYIGHVARVAEAASGQSTMPPHGVCAAWLHDVVEDTPVTLDELRTHFSAQVVSLVEALTFRARDPQETRVAYYARIRANGELATALKLLDVDDNADPARLSLIADVNVSARLIEKYDGARRWLTDPAYAPLQVTTTPLEELRPAHRLMVEAYTDCRHALRRLNEKHVELARELDNVNARSAERRRIYDDLYAVLTEAGVDPDAY